MTAPASPFSPIEQAPPDPILGLTEAFNADPNPRKVNLGVGVYQDSTGKTPVLEVVREAERRLLETERARSYLPIDGLPAYNRAVQQLLFGSDADVVREGRVVTAQALGGTGALRVGADFLRRFLPESAVYLSHPSWENHRALFEAAGFLVATYPYYDSTSRGLDFGATEATLRALSPNSIVVLHAACHNPTGVDPTPAQWDRLVEIAGESGWLPFLDFAYQGLGEGIEEDAYAVRAFASARIPCLIASSFSKSFSLYGERVGALTILTGGVEESKRVLSQLKRVIRANYSSPAAHGGQVVALVLSDPELRQRWEQELEGMRNRILTMRRLLASGLNEATSAGRFDFIALQKGMFSYSGLPLEAVQRLRSEFGLYIVDSGRINVAALNERNLPYVAESIGKVLRELVAG